MLLQIRKKMAPLHKFGSSLIRLEQALATLGFTQCCLIGGATLPELPISFGGRLSSSLWNAFGLSIREKRSFISPSSVDGQMEL
jgi:hypothetical protein